MSGRETILDVEDELRLKFFGDFVAVGECDDIVEVLKALDGERIRILIERVVP